jgi:hypothetical protein
LSTGGGEVSGAARSTDPGCAGRDISAVRQDRGGGAGAAGTSLAATSAIAAGDRVTSGEADRSAIGDCVGKEGIARGAAVARWIDTAGGGRSAGAAGGGLRDVDRVTRRCNDGTGARYGPAVTTVGAVVPVPPLPALPPAPPVEVALAEAEPAITVVPTAVADAAPPDPPIPPLPPVVPVVAFPPLPPLPPFPPVAVAVFEGSVLVALAAGLEPAPPLPPGRPFPPLVPPVVPVVPLDPVSVSVADQAGRAHSTMTKPAAKIMRSALRAAPQSRAFVMVMLTKQAALIRCR